MRILPALLVLAACGQPILLPDEPQGLTAVDFSEGDFRVWRMAVAQPDTDGDGVEDHTLPKLLDLVGLLLDDPDVTTPGVNYWLGTRLDQDQLLLLVSSEVSGVQVHHEFRGGLVDSEGRVYVNPDTVDYDGESLMVLEGAFTGDSAYTATAELVRFPVTLFPGQPQATMAMEQVGMSGTLTHEGHLASVSGAIPVDRLWSELESLFADGYDSNHDGEPEFTAEELEEVFEVVVGSPGMAPIDLGEGRVGVSAIFELVALPCEVHEGALPEDDTGA